MEETTRNPQAPAHETEAHEGFDLEDATAQEARDHLDQLMAREDEDPEADPQAGGDALEGEDAQDEQAEPTEGEALAEQVKALKQELEATKRAVAQRDRTIGRQGLELGELRPIKAALRRRLEQLRSIDPAEQMVSDPAGFREHGRQVAEVEGQLARIEAKEQEQAKREHVAAWMDEQTRAIPRVAPDLAENMPVIKEILEESVRAGTDDSRSVEIFMANPAVFGAAKVQMLNEIARRERLLREAKADAPAKGNLRLEKLERRTARPRVTAGGGGSVRGKQAGTNTPDDIAALSSDDLHAILKQERENERLY